MEKPFVLILHEFKQDLAELLNKYSSAIPATVLVDIIKESEQQLYHIAEQQYIKAQQQYIKEADNNGEESVN